METPIVAHTDERVEPPDADLLDRATSLRAELQQVVLFLERARHLPGPFSAAVRAHVVADYTQRMAMLKDQHAALRTRLQEHAGSLRAAHDRLERQRSDAQFELEELQLRHAVGELGDPVLAEQVPPLKAIVDTCRRDLAEIDDNLARLSAGGPTINVTDVIQIAQEPPTVTDNATANADQTRAVRRPGEIARSGDTLSVPLAALLLDRRDLPATAYPLGFVNDIGRLGDNHICLDRPSVSRRHARIVLNSGSFDLEHVARTNITLVNGQPVRRVRLADGDRITVGDVHLTFRSPWSA